MPNTSNPIESAPATKLVVLVNGLPGAGKTTLARTLSQSIGLPLFSKDTIKEAHAEVLGTEPPTGWPQRHWSAALGAAASHTMWALLAEASGGAVLESCWPTDSHHFAVEGLRRNGIRQPLEVWCDLPLAIARRRFENRHPRHPIHGELPNDAEWERWQQVARPLAIGPVLRIDTTRAVDTEAVTAWISIHGSARKPL
ncbi:hypothetical protein Rhe02_22670 [Rhizocola hellebori]|uniref:ATP-binding protein n=1 Tax=Rhizocola hellebori TaxID=1392758 RepID=A0A8J3Q5G6_9ACTN|nr:AAA family ATPase [Rhizocola hellebori]GIH04200.1 hypothetical protein Rhe02_22670 [Rhizocola hellebori]